MAKTSAVLFLLMKNGYKILLLISTNTCQGSIALMLSHTYSVTIPHKNTIMQCLDVKFTQVLVTLIIIK